MCKFSPTVSAESLPVPSPASLPKASRLLSLRCAKHLAVIWWDRSHLAASSVDLLCTSLYPVLPVSLWNCSKRSFKLVLSPVQIPCNRAREVETGSLSLIRGNSVLCTFVTAQWARVLFSLSQFGLEFEDIAIQAFIGHPVFISSKPSLPISLCPRPPVSLNSLSAPGEPVFENCLW